MIVVTATASPASRLFAKPITWTRSLASWLGSRPGVRLRQEDMATPESFSGQRSTAVIPKGESLAVMEGHRFLVAAAVLQLPADIA